MDWETRTDDLDQLCNICRQSRILEAGLLDGQIEYGTLAELRTRQKCPFCTLLCYLIHLNVEQDCAIIHVERLKASIRQSDSFPRSIFIIHVGRWFCGVIEELSRVDKANLVIVNEPKYNPIDMDKIRRWIDGRSEIKESRNEPGRDHKETNLWVDWLPSLPPIDITLIDVVEQKLVRASSSTRYLALSYVWGQVKMLECLISTRARLEQPGSLSMMRGEIATTIQDAIDFTARLHERYLWVDSLCIEQDNSSQKHAQIAQMNAVYNHAVATIIPITAPNAQSTIPGIRPGSRIPSQADAWICGRAFQISPPSLHQYLAYGYSAYESRGWTFQERLLSKRCLFFTNESLYCYSRGQVLSDSTFKVWYGFDAAVQCIDPIGYQLRKSRLAKMES